MNIRSYKTNDYEYLKLLYLQSELYGGQFNENRDSAEKLQKRIEADPDAILVAEVDEKVLGTVSLIEDGRVAWLFRFAVVKGEYEIHATESLTQTALAILEERGHSEVLIYSPAGNTILDQRYENLEFTKGSDYTCYWQNIS